MNDTVASPQLEAAYAKYTAAQKHLDTFHFADGGRGRRPGKESDAALIAYDKAWEELQTMKESEKNTPREKYLGGPSFLENESAVTAPDAQKGRSPSQEKIAHLREVGYRIRDILSDPAIARLIEFKAPFGSMSVADQGNALFKVLAYKEENLAKLARSPVAQQLVKLVREFQHLVPVLPAAQLSLLTTAPDAGADTAMKAFEMLERGRISEDTFFKGMEVLAKGAGVKLLDSDDPREVAEDLSDKLNTKSGIGAKWIVRGSGSESKVYHDNSGFVYKVTPVQTAMLELPTIKDDSPLYPRMGHHLLSSDQGQIPILERLFAASTISGQAKSDLVGIIDTGFVVFKQHDLGDKEPTAAQIQDWATSHGHVVLPPQSPDPLNQFDNDTSLIPVVAAVDGKFQLLLDVRAGNVRVVGDKVVPFDTISRPLSDAEIEKNPQIKAAVAQLQKKMEVRANKDAAEQTIQELEKSLTKRPRRAKVKAKAVDVDP